MKVYTESSVTATPICNFGNGWGECSVSGTSRFNTGNNSDINRIKGRLSSKAGLGVLQINLLLCQDLIPKLLY
jgi:hypothetical protein